MQYLTLPLFHYFLLRLYSVLRPSDASALPSSTSTSQGAITPESKSNVVPLAVGLTLGLLILAISVLGTLYLQHRRRRKLALLDARATPPHDAQGDKLADAPQESEHRSQPTHGSILLSNTTTATAVPTTSLGIPESGIPPSLTFPGEGSSRSGEVAKTDQATPVEVIEILDEDDEKGDEPPRPIRWWEVNQSRGT